MSNISDAQIVRTAHNIVTLMTELAMCGSLSPIYRDEVELRCSSMLHTILLLSNEARIRDEVVAQVATINPSLHRHLVNIIPKYDKIEKDELNAEMHGDVPNFDDAGKALQAIRDNL